MQVDWTNAPDWANYHAIDSDGRAFFYEEKPEIFNSSKCWNSNLRLTRDDDGKRWDVDDWKETLTERPKEVENMESDKITIDLSSSSPADGSIYANPSNKMRYVINGKDYDSDNLEEIINQNTILKAQVELLKELVKEMGQCK